MSAPPIQKLLEPFINKFLAVEDNAAETAKKIKCLIEEQAQYLPTQIAFSSLMSKFVICALDLLNFSDPRDLVKYKIAGLIVFDCLLDVNDEITPERRIEIANHICKVLENDKIPLSANELIIRTASQCIGHFGRIASTNEIEFLQNFCFPLALKLLSDTRSESHRFSGAVILTQLAQNTPALIFAKRKTLFNVIWDIVSDKNPLVRASASEALESSLQLISQREAMTEYIVMALKQMDAGFVANNTEKAIGGLIILDIIVRGTVVNVSELHSIMKSQNVQFQDLIWKVFQRKDARDGEIRQKVVEIIPSLATAFNATFVQPNNNTSPLNYLGYAIRYLTDVINNKKERQGAYVAMGKLFVAMVHHLRSSSYVPEIYNTVCAGFRDPFCVQALQCLGMIVNVSAACRKLVDAALIDLMFRGGLTIHLIENLKIVLKHAPGIRKHAQIQLRTHIMSILNRYTVLIDEVQGRPPSARYVRHGTQLSSTPGAVSSSIQNSKPASKWNASPSSLFSSLKSENLVAVSSVTGTPIKPETELTFALEVLSSPDFFPKHSRDRSLLAASGLALHPAEDCDQSLLLLTIVRDGVVRYLDDYNPEIRTSAAITCAAVLDIVVMNVDSQCREFDFLYQVLDRLLLMGVGDDSDVIRAVVFESITPSLDHIVAMTENVHCLVEALNDESLQVRIAAMTVMSRVAHYDTLHVMPVVRLSMKRLILTLNSTKDFATKQESVLLLQALVRGSEFLIVPYVKQVMGPLMALLNDSTAAIVVVALSTIGELAMAAPESVREHLDDLTLRLIDALNDQTSVSKQETAVIVLGKLVSSLTMVTDEPYKKYTGLFEGLIRAIQSVDESSQELRLQAIKTLGLLGAVDVHIYQRRLNVHSTILGDLSVQGLLAAEEPQDDAVTEDLNEQKEKDDGKKKLSYIETHYYSVVIRELMNILKDGSLASYHQTAVNIAVKVIRILGQQTPHLKELMDGITYRLYQVDSGNNLREMLLDHVITVIQIIGRGMLPHLKLLLRVICDFFDSNLQQCLDIVEALSSCLSTPDFNTVLRNVIPTFLRVIERETGPEESMSTQLTGGLNLSGDLPTENNSFDMAGKMKIQTQASSSSLAGSERARRASTMSNLPVFTKTSKILQKIVNLSDLLGEYRRELIPFIIKILDSTEVSVDVRRDALCTVMQLGNEAHLLQEFASRIIHPLLRLVTLTEPGMQAATLTALSCLVCRLGNGYVPYIIPVRRRTHNLPLKDGVRPPRLEEYESLVNRLLKQRPLPPEPVDVSDIIIKFDERVRLRGSTSKAGVEGPFSIGMQSLETAWALAGRNNASDLIEWMRRLSIELIRQSPSPVLRACWTLAKTYRPIAEELFNSSLHSIWEELFSADLNDVVDNNQLVNGIEMALQSPQIPANIMMALLNLAEFMEMQDKRLPIDVRLLARQAQSANMYAKCLRYREIEFSSKNVTPSHECVDALITVNNQLGLGDRAAGVLEYLAVHYPKIEIQPLWLEKLFRWDDARRSYEEQINAYKERYSSQVSQSAASSRHEGWMTSELGKLRCLQALGEYEELEECARKLKREIRVADSEAEDVLTAWAPLSEVQRLGANAAWMLGHWSSMDEFLDGETQANETRDVQLENNVSFYRAIMAIHDQDYTKATSLIAETRRLLSGSIGSLLSKSYSRGYRAMVTMQVLAEMEEVVDYKQAVAKAATDLEASKSNSILGDLNTVRGISTLRGDESTGTRQSPGAVDLVLKKQNLIRKWRGRLKWAPKEIDMYRQILAVHTLVAEPMEDLDSWLELVTLCRKEGMHSLCENILRKLGSPLPMKKKLKRSPSESLMALLPLSAPNSSMKEMHPTAAINSSNVNERVLFSTFKYWWSVGEKTRALAEISTYLNTCVLPNTLNIGSGDQSHNTRDAAMFRVRCLLKRADWMRELNGDNVTQILAILMEARELAGDHYSVWHAWAVANYDQLKRADTNKEASASSTASTAVKNNIVSFITPSAITTPKLVSTTPMPSTLTQTPSSTRNKQFSYLTPRKLSSSSGGSASLLNLLSIQQVDAVTSFVVEAIRGFVRSIILGQGQPVANVLQDTLRLITLWFSYGTKKGVFNILESELEKISPDNWISVTPQLIARIHIKSPEISRLLRKLLTKVAVAHPQALVCPISVAMNTNDIQQRLVATEVLTEMRILKSQLVEEATMVSRELMRVAITPHELWYDGLEQAAQLYMDSKDLPAMLNVLKDLHDAMSDGPIVPPTVPETAGRKPFAQQQPEHQGFSESMGKIGTTTLRDVSFRHCYQKVLLEAQEWIEQFRRTGRTSDLHQAWEVYQTVFKKIKGQIASLKKLELHHISPGLTSASDLSLAVPGTYKPSSPDICIKGFSPAIDVIASKQRPRKMTMLGSDGQHYPFLLKGHEDLRQDERVMQLFGLINVCLDNDRMTNNRGLSIVRYSVLPLSNNSGVIGWVQNCDTINQLVKQYREVKEIRLLLEVKLLNSKSQNYDKLPLMHKVELFKQVLDETSGADLSKMLWLKSKTSDVWTERRANFTKSLAVMSMVGYILGLGDRHPSNLMVDRVTGRVVHIDFGDCFEITSQRSKYPEIIPFRLTRMLTNCMETSGTEGTYRLTCERVMRVLRDNRDSVMAMLEAFVYDPLISWRLLNNDESVTGGGEKMSRTNSAEESHKSPVDKMREQLTSSPLPPALSILSDDDNNSDDERNRGATTFASDGQRSPMRHQGAASVREAPLTLRRSKSLELGDGDDEPMQENLNARALEVINRIQAKLTGRDFTKHEDDVDLSVEQQVLRLVREATNVENLCQLFTGWCPLW